MAVIGERGTERIAKILQIATNGLFAPFEQPRKRGNVRKPLGLNLLMNPQEPAIGRPPFGKHSDNHRNDAADECPYGLRGIVREAHGQPLGRYICSTASERAYLATTPFT